MTIATYLDTLLIKSVKEIAHEDYLCTQKNPPQKLILNEMDLQCELYYRLRNPKRYQIKNNFSQKNNTRPDMQIHDFISPEIEIKDKGYKHLGCVYSWECYDWLAGIEFGNEFRGGAIQSRNKIIADLNKLTTRKKEKYLLRYVILFDNLGHLTKEDLNKIKQNLKYDSVTLIYANITKDDVTVIKKK